MNPEENNENEGNDNLQGEGYQNHQEKNTSPPEGGQGDDTVVPSDNESLGENKEQAPPSEEDYLPNESENNNPTAINPDEEEEDSEENPDGLKSDNAMVEPPEENDIREGASAVGPDAKELEVEDEVVEMSTIYKIKEQRVKLDKIEQFHKGRTLISFGNGKSVFLAKAWLGKLLAQLGTENPYKGEDRVKAVQQIPPTAQKAEGVDFNKEKYQFGLLSSLEATLKLRKELGEVITEIEAIDLSEEEIEDGRLAAIAKTQFYVNASEARFDLGMVLASLKK